MGFLEQFAIKLFIALGEYLYSKGLLKLKEWQNVQSYVKRAEKYTEAIKKPDETLEDRLRETDDFMS